MKKLSHKKTRISLLFALLILVVMAVAVVSADSGEVTVNETAVSIVQYEKADKLIAADAYEKVDDAQDTELADHSNKTNVTCKELRRGGAIVSFGYAWSD